MTTKVTGTLIEDGAIGTTHIASQAVTSAKLASGAAASNLGTASITTAMLTDASVTPTKLSQPFTIGTAIISNSGTSKDFTGIPSWVKRITVMFSGVSTSGTSLPMIQVGAGTIITTGYSGAAGNAPHASSPGVNNNSTGFLLEGGTAMSVNATMRHGRATLYLINTNMWAFDTLIGNHTTTNVGFGAGSISMGNTLDRIRITTFNGTDTFDAGWINILFE